MAHALLHSTTCICLWQLLPLQERVHLKCCSSAVLLALWLQSPHRPGYLGTVPGPVHMRDEVALPSTSSEARPASSELVTVPLEDPSRTAAAAFLGVTYGLGARAGVAASASLRSSLGPFARNVALRRRR